MTIIYRELTVTDTDQVLELFDSNPYVYNNYTDEEFVKTLRSLLQSELENPLCFFPGIFVDGKLYCTIYAKESASSPSWTWAHYLFRPKSFDILIKPELIKSLIELDEALFYEMEDRRKLNRFWLVYPYENNSSTTRVSGTIERIWKFIGKAKNFQSRFSMYNFYTDCVVEKNTLPKYNYQQQLLGQRTWPIDLAVRLGVRQSNDNGS